jgi:V8-like Glu-specific endopeptidase
MFPFRLATILAMAVLPICAAESLAADAARHARQPLLHRVAVFSDDPQTVHDPRHPQSQTGTDKMFAPIGLIWTNHPVPHVSGTTTTLNLDMATAFLVSPCYVLTNYHVIFGNGKNKPEADQDYSAMFRVRGKTSRAVPVRYGEFYRFGGRDWALLRLDSDAQHRCLGEDPNIGWVRLVPLTSASTMGRSLSVAGYPSDKSDSSLWRQDTCHLFQTFDDVENDGLWTTDCATRPRASGSPIFFVQDGVLNVVALMSGHLGLDIGNDVLPKWDPSRANLALDIRKIVSSNRDFMKLIEGDIERFQQSNPVQLVQPGDALVAQPPQADPAQSSSEPVP